MYVFYLFLTAADVYVENRKRLEVVPSGVQPSVPTSLLMAMVMVPMSRTFNKDFIFTDSDVDG